MCSLFQVKCEHCYGEFDADFISNHLVNMHSASGDKTLDESEPVMTQVNCEICDDTYGANEIDRHIKNVHGSVRKTVQENKKHVTYPKKVSNLTIQLFYWLNSNLF